MSLEAIAVGWAAAILIGVSKTGIPGVSIPAILMMTEAFGGEARTAVVVLLPVLLVADVFAVSWYRRHAQWDKLLQLLPAVAIGLIPGFLVLKYSDAKMLPPIIGGLVLALVILEVYRRRGGLQKVPNARWFAVSMGALAGFSTMLAHAAMPVMSVYLLSQGFDKRRFLGTASWFFLIVNTSKIPFYLFMEPSLLDRKVVESSLLIAPATVVGCLLGVYVLKKLPEKVFVGLALGLAAIAALKLMGLFSLFVPGM